MAIKRPSVLPTLVFAAGLAAAGVLILSLNSSAGFMADEWDFVLTRTRFTDYAFFDPHNEHIVVVPVAIYQLLVHAFGIESARPFQVVGALMLLTVIALAWVYIRRRTGPWIALALVAPVAVCGAGWDAVLWPFQIAFTGSIACGLGALLLLERPGRGADIGACALLVVAVLFSDLGIAFVIAAAVQIAVAGPGWRQRAYVVVIPVLVYALWWVTWGHKADSYLSLDNILHSPEFVFDGFAASIGALLGVGRIGADPDTFDTLAWGRPVLTVALVAAALWLLRHRRLPRRLWPPLALGLSFWFLTAANANAFREPDTGRYMFIGALFVVLIVGELLRGVAAPRAVLACVLVAAAAATAGNIDGLVLGSRFLRDQSHLDAARFSAVEIARDTVDPEFTTSDWLGQDTAAAYLAAVDAHGSPGYSDAELASADEPVRAAADQTLAEALALQLTPATRSAAGCELERLAEGPAVRRLNAPAGLLIAASGSDVSLGLRRYARESFPVTLGPIPDGAGVVLELPADRARRPWQLALSGSGSIQLCPQPSP